MADGLKTVITSLLKINSDIVGKNEKMPEIERKFNEREIGVPMHIASNRGGKIMYGGSLDSDKYVKAKDVIRNYEFI